MYCSTGWSRSGGAIAASLAASAYTLASNSFIAARWVASWSSSACFSTPIACLSSSSSACNSRHLCSSASSGGLLTLQARAQVGDLLRGELVGLGRTEGCDVFRCQRRLVTVPTKARVYLHQVGNGDMRVHVFC